MSEMEFGNPIPVDYEKKHKEEVVRATQLWECGDITRENLEYIFPELAESEDERIRNVIRGWIYSQPASFFDNGISKEDWLAWLERQGQQLKKVSIWKHWNGGIVGNGNGEQVYLIKTGNVYDVSSTLNWECDYIELSELDKLLLDKQGKQKSADSYCQENCKGFKETGKCFVDGDCKAKKETESANKVKPKSYEGDWVVANACTRYRAKIKAFIENGLVEFEDGTFETEENLVKDYHRWTIADAKDGDVLSAHECIVVFKEIDGLNIKCHCTYHYMGLNPSFYVDTLQNKTAFQPATKEQRDLLFQKMKEAGYEWSDKDRKLIKIVQ